MSLRWNILKLIRFSRKSFESKLTSQKTLKCDYYKLVITFLPYLNL